MMGSMLPFILTPLPSYNRAFHADVDVAAWMSLSFLVATVAVYKLDMLLLRSFGQSCHSFGSCCLLVVSVAFCFDSVAA